MQLNNAIGISNAKAAAVENLKLQADSREREISSLKYITSFFISFLVFLATKKKRPLQWPFGANILLII